MDLLIAKITEEVALSPIEEKQIRASFKKKKLRKRQNVLHFGETLQQVLFVEKGLLRGYLKGEKEEYVIQFAPEGSWIPDTFYDMPNLKAQFNIDAVENSEVLYIDQDDCQNLIEEIPKLERYFRVVMQQRLYALHLRVINLIVNYAEDRYKAFTTIYPEIVQRVPQHMIASYLGIQPETLSRNRKKMATKRKSSNHS